MAGVMVSGVVVWRSAVSRLWCRGPLCQYLLGRGYGVGGGYGVEGRRVEVHCVEASGSYCEVRGDVKNMIGGGCGGVNGRFCGPKGQWS